jgi:hypothetical protein
MTFNQGSAITLLSGTPDALSVEINQLLISPPMAGDRTPMTKYVPAKV